MASDYDFTPKQGRPGNLGSGAITRYGKKVRRQIARHGKVRSRSKFTGSKIGRGAAAARLSAFQSRSYQRMRRRRVVVKTHISRASTGIGSRAYKAHLNYIQRDGVDHDGTGGELYDRNNDRLDDGDFLSRSKDDRHQFRVIFSAEDADQLDDLKETTRAYMDRMEKDLGTKLDWVAVDHHNTGHPHTHIVIRGVDDMGKDLVIAKEYITRGMRELAQDIVTERLGVRRDMEIARAQASEVTNEQYTGIDREVAAQVNAGMVEIGKTEGSYNRFRRSLQIQRLGELEKLQLATKAGKMRWELHEGWEDSLRKLGKRGDIIRSISAAMGATKTPTSVREFESGNILQKPVLGRIAGIGPEDELRDTRFIIVEGTDGAHWHVALGTYAPGTLPKPGAIVEVSALPAKPKQADHVIAEVAASNEGVYSDALHEAHDPGSSAQFREAHKRRLEALRRAGSVERFEDGSWQIGEGFLERAKAYEQARTSSAKLDVKSWLPLNELPNWSGLTWLDDLAASEIGNGSLGSEVHNALEARTRHLSQSGVLKEGKTKLSVGQRHMLAASERRAAANAEAAKSNRAYVSVASGETRSGIYEKPVNLAQGRFAIIGQAKEFTLVPWRSELETHRGKDLTIRGTNKGVGWSLTRKKGIGR